MTKIDPAAAVLNAALAQELRQVGQMVEDLAETLVGDTYFTTIYIETLQVFDLIVQSMGEGADLLDRLAAGTDARTAIEPVRLGAIQARLREALTLREAA